MSAESVRKTTTEEWEWRCHWCHFSPETLHSTAGAARAEYWQHVGICADVKEFLNEGASQ